MKIEDRLKKAERELREHQEVCKTCENSIYDVTSQNCSIALALLRKIDKIKKQMQGHK